MLCICGAICAVICGFAIWIIPRKNWICRVMIALCLVFSVSVAQAFFRPVSLSEYQDFQKTKEFLENQVAKTEAEEIALAIKKMDANEWLYKAQDNYYVGINRNRKS